MSKRGRPRYYSTGRHVYVVVENNKLHFQVLGSTWEALEQYKSGVVVGQLEVSDYLSRENEYQDYFKERFIKGEHEKVD